MGCDIHFYVEVRIAPDQQWVTADAWQPDDIDGSPEVASHHAFYTARNYSLFALLAGVRGDEKPIAAPRGIPDDACPEYKAAAKNYGSDGHSHSWLTLEELEAHEGRLSRASEDFHVTRERMWQAAWNLVARGNPAQNVRCCFFFDN